MGNSLQDQFLKLGLVAKKDYNKAKKEKHDNIRTAAPKSNEIAEMAKQALAEKKKRDMQLNKKKIAERQVREATARARQLIETHRITIGEGNVAYNFRDENRVKKIYLPEKIIESLVAGKAGIVKLAGEYQVVPADIIYKIRELNANMVVLLNSPVEKKQKSDDDPYAGYEVPDDLMW